MEIRDDINSEQLKEKIRLAKEAVINESEPFKTEAFKIILNKLLESNLTTKITTVVPESLNTIKPQNEYSDIYEKKKDLALKCDITIDELNDIILIKNDVVEIIKPIPGKTDSIKHIIISLCVLAVYDVVLGIEWVTSAKLTESMRSLGVRDLSNLAPHLKRSSNYFRVQGSRGHNEYKLTSAQGRQKAFQVIHQLAKNDEDIQI